MSERSSKIKREREGMPSRCESFPPEIWCEILSHLELHPALCLSRTCRTIRDGVKLPTLHSRKRLNFGQFYGYNSEKEDCVDPGSFVECIRTSTHCEYLIIPYWDSVLTDALCSTNYPLIHLDLSRPTRHLGSRKASLADRRRDRVLGTIDDTTIDRITAATSSTLKSLNLRNVKSVTDTILPLIIGNCSNHLEYLNLGHCEKISSVGGLNDLFLGCLKLRELYIGHTEAAKSFYIHPNVMSLDRIIRVNCIDGTRLRPLNLFCSKCDELLVENVESYMKGTGTQEHIHFELYFNNTLDDDKTMRAKFRYYENGQPVYIDPEEFYEGPDDPITNENFPDNITKRTCKNLCHAPKHRFLFCRQDYQPNFIDTMGYKWAAACGNGLVYTKDRLVGSDNCLDDEFCLDYEFGN